MRTSRYGISRQSGDGDTRVRDEDSLINNVRGHVLGPAWLSRHSEDSSFNAKMKTFANKISHIVSHLAKHPIYGTVSFH